MAEHPARQPTARVPAVPCPDAFGLFALDTLPEVHLDAVAKAAQRASARRIRIRGGVAVQSEQANAVRRHRLRQLRPPGGAISDQIAGGLRDQSAGDFGCRAVGRGERQPGNDSWPRQADRAADAGEGLPTSLS